MTSTIRDEKGQELLQHATLQVLSSLVFFFKQIDRCLFKSCFSMSTLSHWCSNSSGLEDFPDDIECTSVSIRKTTSRISVH